MNEIVKVDYNSNRPTVLGRDLHKALEVQTPYKKWFDRMCEYGFAENSDFVLVRQNCPTNNQFLDGEQKCLSYRLEVK